MTDPHDRAGSTQNSLPDESAYSRKAAHLRLATPAHDAARQAQLMALVDPAPHLVEMMAEIAHDDPDSTLGWCDDQAEFEFSLDLLLEGLKRHRSAGWPR